MDPFSNAPKMELIVWGSTMVMAVGALVDSRLRRQVKSATAGAIQPGSTGPRIWTSLAILGQLCGFTLPQLVYLTATICNKFRQPEWMTEYALPSPPGVFRLSGVTVGRAVGLLGALAGTILTHAAMEALGDQYHSTGVSALPYHGLPRTRRRLTSLLGYR